MYASFCAGLSHWWHRAWFATLASYGTGFNKFCARSEWSLKAFLTLVEIIEVTKSFLYNTRLPVTRWVKLSLNFEFLVPK